MKVSVALFILLSLYGSNSFYFADDCGIECYATLLKGSNQNGTVEWEVPQFAVDTSGDIGPIQVKFLLYTRYTLNNPECFILNTTEEIYESFDPSKPLKILVHGWIGSMKSPFVQTLLKAYLPAYDYNIIVVDWEQESHRIYPMARHSVPEIGAILAQFIELLHTEYKISPETLHILGHSLGAHVSGIAGHLLTSGTLGRITGLDPALPLFFEYSSERLNKDSANFVDVIHTCGLFLGWFDTIGHTDFYPNRGTPIQPGCGMDILGSCSHCRSYRFFSESILNQEQFIAVPCDSWDHYKHKNCGRYFVNMGENVPFNTTGTYYLTTNEHSPFGRGVEEIINF